MQGQVVEVEGGGNAKESWCARLSKARTTENKMRDWKTKLEKLRSSLVRASQRPPVRKRGDAKGQCMLLMEENDQRKGRRKRNALAQIEHRILKSKHV